MSKKRSQKMTKLLLQLLVITSLFGQFASAGDKAGNGQLLTEIDGQWVPVEAALVKDTRLYRGVEGLPTGTPGNEAPQFNRDYGASLKKWLLVLEQYSPGQAEIFKRVGSQTDFVYVAKDLVFLPEEYPKLPVKYDNFRTAAIYFNQKIYISIPNMDAIGELDGISKKEHQGFVLLHELINAAYIKREYSKYYLQTASKGWLTHVVLSDSDRLQMGQMILEIKARNWSPTRYLTETALENYSFWRMPAVPNALKVDVLSEVLKSKRAPWNSIFTNVTDTRAISELLALAERKEKIDSIVKSDGDFSNFLGSAIVSAQAGIRITDGQYSNNLIGALGFFDSLLPLYQNGTLKDLRFHQHQIKAKLGMFESIHKTWEKGHLTVDTTDSSNLGESDTFTNYYMIKSNLDALLKKLEEIGDQLWNSQDYSWLDPKTLEIAGGWPQTKNGHNDYSIKAVVELQKAFEVANSKVISENVPAVLGFLSRYRSCNVPNREGKLEVPVPEYRPKERVIAAGYYSDLSRKFQEFCVSKTGNRCLEQDGGSCTSPFIMGEKTETFYFMVTKSLSPGVQPFQVVKFELDKSFYDDRAPKTWGTKPYLETVTGKKGVRIDPALYFTKGPSRNVFSYKEAGALVLLNK
jgi:hypothetical protein